MHRGQRAKKILHPLNHELYHYHLGPRMDPGAQAEIFQPLFQNPVISFRGAGRLAGALRPTQPPQLWFLQQVGVNGLGGLQAGTMRLQPLMDPLQLEGVQ